jgi:hypothetical protein
MFQYLKEKCFKYLHSWNILYILNISAIYCILGTNVKRLSMAFEIHISQLQEKFLIFAQNISRPRGVFVNQ